MTSEGESDDAATPHVRTDGLGKKAGVPISPANGDARVAVTDDEQQAQGEANIIWAYKLHEESVFYQRLNLFLVAESMLFVAFATFVASDSASRIHAYAACVLGILLTIVWLLVSRRQVVVMGHVSQEAEKLVTPYGRVKRERPSSSIPSTWLLAYVIPALVMLAWCVGIWATCSDTKRRATEPPGHDPGIATAPVDPPPDDPVPGTAGGGGAGPDTEASAQQQERVAGEETPNPTATGATDVRTEVRTDAPDPAVPEGG